MNQLLDLRKCLVLQPCCPVCRLPILLQAAVSDRVWVRCVNWDEEGDEEVYFWPAVVTEKQVTCLQCLY